MSITSRARDALKFPDRTETSREAVAARFRLREVDAERTAAERPYGGVAHAGRALFAHITDLQHMAHTLLVQQLREGTDPVTQARKSRVAQVKAFREWRKNSVVRRSATPVVNTVGDFYSTLSNGQRVRNDRFAIKASAHAHA